MKPLDRGEQQGFAQLPSSYAALLEDIKERIRRAHLRAAAASSRELIGLYWYIGKSIVDRQRGDGWGRSVVERLALDLQKTFPGVAGFSPLNVWRMRAFHLAWTEDLQKLSPPVTESAAKKLSQLVTEIPWGHNIVLVQRIKDPLARIWYARMTVERGWSRDILVAQIESRLHAREGKALTNFKATLPAPQSDFAQQVLKDPYIFDFLTFDSGTRERELEQGLLDHIQKFILEMGVGFAFVGRQVHLEVGGEDYYLDLLFYHLRLRCFVVIELKVGDFKPEFAGKMNFYLSAVDDQIRHQDDRPTIGLLLCKSRDRLIVEYALRDMKKPIGVAEWKLKIIKSLPKEFKGSLPTLKEIEAELIGGKGAKG
jgi:predicted nuclease of restriction endonuclease-like (RecB) superfamily